MKASLYGDSRTRSAQLRSRSSTGHAQPEATALSARDLRKALWPLLLVALTLVLTSWAISLAGLSETWGAWLWVFPLGLAVGCFGTAARLVRKEPSWIVSPLFWCLLAVGTYFGFGPLVYTFGNPGTVVRLDYAFVVDDYWLFQTNLVDQVGLLALVLGALVGSRIGLPKGLVSRLDSLSRIDARQVFLVTAAIGVVAKYVVDLPSIFHILSFTPPTSLSTLGDLTLAAILMSGYLSASRPSYRLPFVVLLFAEVSTNLLLNSKQAVLEAVIVAIVGLVLGTRRRAILVVAAIAVPLALTTLVPIVNESRQLGIESPSSGYADAVGARLDVMSEAVTRYLTGNLTGGAGSSQAWWSRLCYSPEEAFAMNEYDMGRPGSFVTDALWSFVPRFIWPEKPLINPGVAFSIDFDGNANNSVAAGTFGEGYWNGGWLGAVAFGLYIGLVLAILNSISNGIVTRQAWPAMLFVVLGIRAGFRIDGWFAMEYVGGIVIYLALLSVVLALFSRPAGRRL